MLAVVGSVPCLSGGHQKTTEEVDSVLLHQETHWTSPLTLMFQTTLKSTKIPNEILLFHAWSIIITHLRSHTNSYRATSAS